eukprot:1719377-Pleurochrysis_carterae.AAC.1
MHAKGAAHHIINARTRHTDARHDALNSHTVATHHICRTRPHHILLNRTKHRRYDVRSSPRTRPLRHALH